MPAITRQDARALRLGRGIAQEIERGHSGSQRRSRPFWSEHGPIVLVLLAALAVRLHGLSRRYVVLCNGECKRKVARAKDRNRSQRTKHRAEICPRQRSATRLRWINSSHRPRPLFDKLRKEPKLRDGSPNLSLKPLFRKSCLTMRSLHQFNRDAFDSCPDVAKESALFPPG